MTDRFNVRVYGILLKDDKVLVSDEYIRKTRITKFPGGGLEFGEGTRDCLVREFREELDIPIVVGEHFYTTDFFVSSAFNAEVQVISIYYLVQMRGSDKVSVSGKAHDYLLKEGAQSFRWINLSDIVESDLTLIIDKKVASMIKERFL